MINPSTDWKARLHKEIYACHVAVVFVNKQALEDSVWVPYEVTTLMNRWRCEKDRFFLIPVPFDDVDAEEIAAHPVWTPAGLGQVQCLPGDRLEVSDEGAVRCFLRKIVAQLKEVPEDDEFTSDIINRARLCLSEGKGVLKGIAEMVGLPRSYDSHDFTQYIITRRLYFRGPSVYPALIEFPGFPDKCKCLNFIDLLATYWVDVASSRPIYGARSKKGNVFVINGFEVNFTPNIYVRHVCKVEPAWEVIQVDIMHQYADVVEDIYLRLSNSPRYRKVLMDDVVKNEENTALSVTEEKKRGHIPPMTEEVIQKISKKMEGEYVPPVFVAFRKDEVTSVIDFIGVIHTAFKHINIIILTGKEPVSSFELPGYHPIPLREISLKREHEEFEIYKAVKDCL